MSLTASSLPYRTPPGPLRLRRLALGLTQADVATATGLSREQIVRLEAGRCDPHWRTVQALAGALSAAADELFPTTSEGPAGNGTSAKLAVMGDGRGTA